MLERDFQKQVIKFLKDYNIYYIKVWGGGYQRSGIPDLIICLKGEFIAIELKNEEGKPSPLQIYNIDKIKQSGGQAFILRPSQFENFKREVLKHVQLQ